MSLQVGARVGSYEVVSLLGAGGMGEVYRATDTKLKRDVALKLLPDSFAADPDRLARFEREAHVLASLNHPQIAAVYGLEDKGEGAPPVLVMELVDGEDLSARIARGAIPLDEALPLARQIAEGLEAAHDAGVVHRDLKPANIKVRPDGRVKVLDFGLAKAVENAASASGTGSPHLSFSPTMTSPAHMTSFGVVLGTAAYMSPEQAKGRPVDKRADVWAFGAVLFEMLTGRPCFHGDDVSEMFAAVLRETPDWTALPPGTPAAIHRLLRRCLERDVHSRLSDMAMVRVELRDAETEPPPIAAAPVVAAPPTPSIIRRLAPYAAAIVAALVTGVVVWRMRQPVETVEPLTRFSIELPDQVALSPNGRNPVAISPDGTRLVYAANGQLYLRSIDQFDATPITGTAAGGRLVISPFFSPDGQWIGFWQSATTGGQLRKIPISGGAAVTIADVGAPFGVSWEPDGRILLGLGAPGIMWVPATGGTVASLVAMKNGERAGGPQQLPGGDWVLFMHGSAAATADQSEAMIQSRSSGERRVLLSGVREARYLPSGHLVFGRGNTLLAQAFDVKRMALSGGPVPIVDGVWNAGNATPAMYFAVSATGTLFYVPGTTAGSTATKLVEVTREGTRKVLTEVAGMSWFPRFSPDGKRLAYGLSLSGDLSDASDLWVLDVERGARTRVTFSGNNRFYPIWTRDGTRLVHADATATPNQLLSTLADGSGVNETLVDKAPRMFPSSWSPDGRVLASYHNGPTNTRDVAMLTTTGDKRTLVPFVATPFEERGAIFSPDGRWIAYVSNKTGQNDVFARPYPGPGAEVTVSAGGGQEPVWGPSGKELFYRHGGALQVVRIDGTGTELKVGSPARVFDDPFRLDTGGAQGGMANYDIAPDGKRFVMVEEPKAVSGSTTNKLAVVANWFDELRRRVPAK